MRKYIPLLIINIGIIIPLNSFPQILDLTENSHILAVNKGYGNLNDICDCNNRELSDTLEVNIKTRKLPEIIRKEFKGMIYINEGCSQINVENIYTPIESDTTLLFFNHNTKICTEPFLLDEKEVTNAEFKEFVNWVKDSVVRTVLAERDARYYKNAEKKILDWEVPINWSDSIVQQELYWKEKTKYYRRSEFKTEKIIYSYTDGDKNISILIFPDTLKWVKEFTYSFNEPMTQMYFWHPAYDNYPVVGITYNQAKAYCHWKTEQLIKKLKAEDCLKNYKLEYRLPTAEEWEYAALGEVNEYNTRWFTKYFPWKDDNLMDDEGKYKANFGLITDKNKILIKSFEDDGFFHTAPVGQFRANIFGLYDMAGNVSEWTEDVPHLMSLEDYFSCYPFSDTLLINENTSITNTDDVHSLLYRIADIQSRNGVCESNIDTIHENGRSRIIRDAENMIHDYNVVLKTNNPRIVKGGSWADHAIYMVMYMNQVYAEDSSSCKVGFRLALTVPTEILPYFYSNNYEKKQAEEYKADMKKRKKLKKGSKFIYK